MTDIFISYSRQHRERIKPIVDALRALYLDVWFDAELVPGDVFSDRIEAHLKMAKCVLVLWTKDAIDKGPRGWVRSEADWALQRDKLIQAQLEAVKLPPPFFSSVAPPLDLAAIQSPQRNDSSGWLGLLQAVSKYVKRPGLPHLPSAQRSDEDLIAWAARYSDDPLSVGVDEYDTPLTKRIRVARLAAIARTKQTPVLKFELRDLMRGEKHTLPFEYGAEPLIIGKRDRGPRISGPLAGPDIDVYGLEFFDLAVERAVAGDVPVIIVTGEVRNLGRDDKAVPSVRIALTDAHAKKVHEIVCVFADQIVSAGASAPFSIRIERPPEAATDLEATFAGPDDVSENATAQSELLLDIPIENS